MTVNQQSSPETAGLRSSRLARWCMYGLMAFPIIDYALRFGPAHPLGVVWDKLVMAGLLILVIGRYVGGHRPRWFQWNKFAAWFMLLGLAIMFAGFSNPGIAIQGYRIDVYYIFYAFLIPFVVEPEDVPKLLHVAAMVGILIAVHGVYQYVTKAANPRMWVGVNESVRTRVYSVLQSPNELGAYMALMTPLIAGLALYETHKWRKRLYILGIPFCVLTLLFTMTRGAWMALAVAILIMAVLFERRLLIVLAVFAVIAFFLPPIHHRIADLLSPVYWLNSSQSGRVFKWITAFDKMGSNPLFGVGTGRFGGAVSSLYQGGIYSDNYYAKTLAETGLVGLTLFLAMHLSLVKELLTKAVRRATGRSRFVAIGATTGLIAVLIHNMMENVFEFAPMVLAYFVIASLLLVWSTGFEQPPHARANADVADNGGTP